MPWSKDADLTVLGPENHPFHIDVSWWPGQADIHLRKGDLHLVADMTNTTFPKPIPIPRTSPKSIPIPIPILGSCRSSIPIPIPIPIPEESDLQYQYQYQYWPKHQYLNTNTKTCCQFYFIVFTKLFQFYQI